MQVDSPVVKSEDAGPEPLALLRKKHDLIRARIAGVYDSVCPGLYLYGPGGTGKTFIVREALQQLRSDDPNPRDVHYHHGHLTPMGLFDLLREHEDNVIILDDVHHLFEQRVSQQLLLAALGTPEDGVRMIRYRRQNLSQESAFRGGLIAISNVDIVNGSTNPVLRALSSRTHVMRFAPTDSEIEGLIQHLAETGWNRSDGQRSMELTTEQCIEVASFVVAECRRRARPLDLRVFLDKALPDYWLCLHGELEVAWRDLVRSSIEEEVVRLEFTDSAEFASSKASSVASDRAIMTQLAAEFGTANERLVAWRERTGKTERTYYRRWREFSAKKTT